MNELNLQYQSIHQFINDWMNEWMNDYDDNDDNEDLPRQLLISCLSQRKQEYIKQQASTNYR